MITEKKETRHIRRKSNGFFQLNTIKKIQNEDSIINSEKYYVKKCDDKFLIVAPKNSGWCLVDAELLPFIRAVEGMSVKIKDIKKYFYGPIHRIHKTINTLYNKNIIGINGEWLFDVKAYDKYREVRLTCLIIKLTRQCNLNCKYCYADAVSENDKLSYKIGYKAIKDFISYEKASDRVRILFTGGEPLMNWDCLVSLARDAITFGKKFGKAVELNLQTNGVLLDQNKLSLLKDLNFRIGMSLDGYDEVSNSLRIFRNGRNSFHSVCSKIGILNSSDISYGILSTITKKNINKIPEYVVWLEKMNCRSLKFSWIYNQGRAREKTDLIPSASEGIDLMKKLIMMIERREITNLALVSLLYYLDTLLLFDRPYMCRRSPCGAITSVLSLDTNGDIYPCDCVTGVKDMRLGNILRDTINQIVHNEISLKLRSRSAESVSECKQCPWRLMCSSPCPARSYANHNNWFSLDKNECEISREFYPYLTEKIAKSSILLNYWKKYSTSAKVIREIV